MTDTAMRTRLPIHWIVLIVAMIAPTDAVAQWPEPLPTYSDAEALCEDATLRGIAFADDQVGVAVGDRGCLVRSIDGGVRWTRVASPVQCQLSDVAWISPTRVVAVGGAYDRVTSLSRGVVLVSDDAGKRWYRADDTELPRLRSVKRNPTDNSVSVSGDFSPIGFGSVYTSTDGGRTWHPDAHAVVPNPVELSLVQQRSWAAATGVNAAIRKSLRIGDDIIIAAGDHGVIVRSADQGRTWLVARGQGRKAGVLVVGNSVQTTPWPVIGNEALEQRHRVTVLLRDHFSAFGAGGVRVAPTIDGSDAAEKRDLVSRDLANQAAVMLGASGTDMLAQTALPAAAAADVAINDVLFDAAAIDAALTIHRPAVLVVDVDLPSQMRSQLSSAAIAHGVKRVVVSQIGVRGDSSLHVGALLPRIGVLAGDFWEDALQLVAAQQVPAKSIGLSYAYDSSVSPRRGDSVTAGISFSAGASLAAEVYTSSRRKMQIAQARMTFRSKIDDLIAPSTNAQTLRDSVDAILKQTAAEDKFRILWHVQQRARTVGSEELEAVSLKFLSDELPNTSVGRWAGLKRQSIAGSREHARLRTTIGDESSFNSKVAQAAEVVPVSPFQVADSGVIQASATSPVSTSQNSTSPFNTPNSGAPLSTTLFVHEEAPVEYQSESHVQSLIDLGWDFHPASLIVQDSFRDRSDSGKLQPVEGPSAGVQRLAEVTAAGCWSDLIRKRSPQSLIALRSVAPPRLDGQLDDACWRSAGSVAQHDGLEIRVAYDDDYVYLAMSGTASRIGDDVDGQKDSRQTRDHDLRNVDRVEVDLDIDKDLFTAMSLQATKLGRTHDAIDGNPAWQPTWYVAPPEGDATGGFEIAILRRDLTELPIHAGEEWFVSPRLANAGSATELPLMPSGVGVIRVTFQ